MGGSCSKASSTTVSGQPLQPQPSFSQYSNSPYLADNASFTHKSSHTAVADAQQDSGLIQARHDAASALTSPAVSAADALQPSLDLSSASSPHVAEKPAPVSPSIVQHSLQEAAAVYTQPMSRSPYANRTTGKASHGSIQVKQALAKNSTFASALKALGKQAPPETAPQLLQHYLFHKKAVTVTELDNAVAAVSAQPAPIQAGYAAELIAQQYYFAAMKATFTQPQILSRVLRDIQQQVNLYSAQASVSLTIALSASSACCVTKHLVVQDRQITTHACRIPAEQYIALFI